MASPQAENGHIDIANEIAEQLAKTQLSGYESRVLWVLWRKTYGWHKKSDYISTTQFVKATNIARRHVHATLKRLVRRNLITENSNGFITGWTFQKDYNQWQPVTEISNKINSLPIPVPLVTENSNKLVTEIGAHKRKERTYTKESIDVVFSFWKETLKHPKAILSKDRIGFIKARIMEGHTVEECKQAILGCKASSYHMGDNDRHKVYDSIELIFRKGDKFEQFIGYLNQTDNSDIDNLPDLMEK